MPFNHHGHSHDKGSDGDGDFDSGVNEGTRLLMLPSPTSTDRPTASYMSSLRALLTGGGRRETAQGGGEETSIRSSTSTIPFLKKSKSGSTVPEIQLACSFGSLEGLGNGTDGFFVVDENGKPRSEQGSGIFNRCSKCVPCLAVLVVLVAAVTSASSFYLNKMHPVFPHQPHGGGGGKGTKGVDNKSLSSWSFYQRPLSLLDPVKDLGLSAHERSKDSSPFEVLTHQYRSSPQSDKRTNSMRSTETTTTNTSTTTKPFPTNAWYQNLLLLQDGDEPTELHHTYSTPYIIDMAGPIPGLRVHPNRVAASSTVVQTYSVEAYGLTLGAAADATETTKAAKAKDEASTTAATNRYRVQKTTNLGVTLEWDHFPMTSSIVKGMPYATMIYNQIQKNHPQMKESTDTAGEQQSILLPTVASKVGLAAKPVVDGGARELNCVDSDSSSHNKPQLVERDVEMLFEQSDFTWLVFFSEPVYVQCIVVSDGNDIEDVVHVGGKQVMVQVLSTVQQREQEQREEQQHQKEEEQHAPLVVRMALYKVCTTGKTPSNAYCHQEQMHPTALFLGQGDYGKILRQHAHLYPGPDTEFRFEIDGDGGDNDNGNSGSGGGKMISMTFDWDAREMDGSSRSAGVGKIRNETYRELITFALPHHFSSLVGGDGENDKHSNLVFSGNNLIFGEQIYCSSSIVGPACLVRGAEWILSEAIPELGFRAPRPPAPWALEALAKSLPVDLSFQMPDYYGRGAGDTYFSGKILAKLGRILLVAEELREVCSSGSSSAAAAMPEYKEACEGLVVPSSDDMSAAVKRLRSAVEVWLDGTAETPFVFDPAWKGVVSCGCNFDHKQCSNKYPDCPAFTDTGLDFGNAFYNDQHFHYGYHIYAAAVVAHFDPEWGRRFFERVLLLVRNIANPSDDDPYFPTWRHKDWYQGHSWASGIALPYLNGKNQESSSESIAAYEAIALYGDVMSKIFSTSSESDRRQGQVARQIRGIGQVMTATELKSAKAYWHVSQSTENEVKIYPSEYSPKIVSMVWQMMAQFQTWFGNSPYLAYGIQLLPVTPVAELRDEVGWAKEMYPEFAESCEGEPQCTGSGWSVLQMIMLATVGHPKDAMKKVMAMPVDNFDGPAGDGHSLSNTLWYIATRPEVKNPLPLNNSATDDNGGDAADNEEVSDELTDCYRPDSCNDFVLDTTAGLYSCRQRIQWLIKIMGQTQREACLQIGGVENPKECGLCNPNGTIVKSSPDDPHCPPCTPEECASDELNRCPRYKRTYVCTSGPSLGGCSGYPGDFLYTGQCNHCCELTSCPPVNAVVQSAAVVATPAVGKKNDRPIVSDNDDSCPKCPCRTKNQCPPSGDAPFLCYEGPSAGGCATRPWVIGSSGGGGPQQCSKCCKVDPECRA